MKKIIWTVIVLVIIALVAIFAGRDSATSGPVKIGVLTPLSGPIAIAGEVQKNAINLALDDLKASGVDVTRYELVYEDSKYDPKTSLSGYEALKLKGVKIIIADGSPVVAAIRAKAEQDGIIVFAQSATTPAFTDTSPFTCRIGLTADIVGSSMSGYAKDIFGAKTLAILTSNNEYGKVMKDEIEKSFSGKITAVEIFDQASGDLRTNILKLLQVQKDTDAIVVINNITPEPMFKQLRELGWNKPILSDIWTITSPNMKNRTVSSGVNFIDYTYSSQPDLNADVGAKKYAERYANTYKGSPILLGALTYDSFNILVQGLNKVGSDPKKLSDYLTSMPEYQGITGSIDLDSSCQNTNSKFVWRKVLDDGMFQNVK
jgi:branched-chain amino acid transport system substrate-binding protein